MLVFTVTNVEGFGMRPVMVSAYTIMFLKNIALISRLPNHKMVTN